MAGRGNILPVYDEFLGDLESPVSLYLKIKHSPYSFLLESADGNKRPNRYSYIGYEPLIVVRTLKNRVEVIENGRVTNYPGQINPLPVMRALGQRYKPVILPELSKFQGGLVGFLNYDLIRAWENLPGFAAEDEEWPEAVFMAPRRLIIFDHLTLQVKVVVFALLDDTKNLKEAYAETSQAVAETTGILKQPLGARESEAGPVISRLKSNFPKKKFEEAVEKAKEYIRAGDIFQVVLSQKFSAQIEGDDFWLYRRLRTINPSPYMFYLHFEKILLIGASPEILVRLIDRRIEYRPIAGTRSRGGNAGEDAVLKQDLLGDAKERAEHIMLVDLGRNDVGKVAEAGTVQVPQLMEVEDYSHVMHMVSQVEGRLRKDLDGFDLFMAAFPAGTVSGAPKIRAMEIIRELEPSRRGPYAGAVGYFAFNGNLDFCITIRTMAVKGNRLSIQAGAGIVYDSVPENEYTETLKKAGALFRTLGLENLYDFDDR
jgi:anthranilate synthase component 1